MSTLSLVPISLASRIRAWRRPEFTWRHVRWSLLVGVLALAVLGRVFGAASATLAELKADLASGQVTQVRLTPGLPDGASGYTTVEVVWRDGDIRRYTKLIEQSDATVEPPSSQSSNEVVVGKVAEVLTATTGGTPSVTQVSDVDLSVNFWGWHIPRWLTWFIAFEAVGSILLLICGPEPWWATRWAWFWLGVTALAPLALLGFLAMSGPPPGTGSVAEPGRRLRGGWAFLITLVFGPLLAGAAGQI